MRVPDLFGLAASKNGIKYEQTYIDYEMKNALLVWTHPLAQPPLEWQTSQTNKDFPQITFASWRISLNSSLATQLFACPLWERKVKKTWARKNTYHHSDANQLSLSFLSIEISPSPFSTFFLKLQSGASGCYKGFVKWGFPVPLAGHFFLGLHGSCILAQRPAEHLWNIHPNIFNNLMPQTVLPDCNFSKKTTFKPVTPRVRSTSSFLLSVLLWLKIGRRRRLSVCPPLHLSSWCA